VRGEGADHELVAFERDARELLAEAREAHEIAGLREIELEHGQ